MTVESITFQLLSVVEKGADVSLQPVPQIANVWAPLEIARQVSQRHSKSGEHHARNG